MQLCKTLQQLKQCIFDVPPKLCRFVTLRPRTQQDKCTIKPLVERTVMPKMAYISYEDFIENFTKNAVANHLYQHTIPEIDTLKVFEAKIRFLMETKSDMTSCKREIRELWTFCNEIISLELNASIQSLNDVYLSALVSITGEADFSNDEKVIIIRNLEGIIRNRFESNFSKKEDFSYNVKDLISWYYYHNIYVSYLGQTFYIGEISYLKRIVKNNLTQLETLKIILSNFTFISFVETIKWIYKSLETGKSPSLIAFIYKCHLNK